MNSNLVDFREVCTPVALNLYHHGSEIDVRGNHSGIDRKGLHMGLGVDIVVKGGKGQEHSLGLDRRPVAQLTERGHMETLESGLPTILIALPIHNAPQHDVAGAS